MRKKLSIASVAMAGLLAPVTVSVPAMAVVTYQVNGSVPQICSVEQPQLLSDAAQINVNSVSGQSIGITQLTDPRTMATNAASFDVGFTAVCNYAHRLVVESQNNGLWRDQPVQAAPGFADAVPYSAQIDWGGTSTTFRANAAVRQIENVQIPVNHPASGQIELRFQVLAGSSNALSYTPLLAGTYRDIIRVTVEPQ